MSACEGGEKKKEVTLQQQQLLMPDCTALLKISAFSGAPLYLQKFMHMQIRSEINPYFTYQHIWQATDTPLLQHKLS